MFFTIDTSLWKPADATKGVIVGTNETESAIAPSDALPIIYGALDRTKLGQYRQLQTEQVQDGMDGFVLWNDGLLQKQPDNRPFVEVTSDKAEIDADGAEVAVITFRLLNADGTPDLSTVTKKIRMDFGQERMRSFKLGFVSGVATKNFKTAKSGEYQVYSNRTIKVKTRLTVEAFE